MKLLTKTIESIASRKVYSNDWCAPFCDAILLYKKGMYSHTHPEWHTQEKELLQDCDVSNKHNGYTTPWKITFIKFSERGIHLPQNRKCIYISLKGTNIVHLTTNSPLHILGELDKIKTTPSWRADMWNQKKIQSHDIKEYELFIAGNTTSSCVYPETGNAFIQVEYEE